MCYHHIITLTFLSPFSVNFTLKRHHIIIFLCLLFNFFHLSQKVIIIFVAIITINKISIHKHFLPFFILLNAIYIGSIVLSLMMVEIAFTFIDNIFYWIIHFFLSSSTSSSSSFQLEKKHHRNLYVKRKLYICLISNTNTMAQFQHASIFLIIILLLSLCVCLCVSFVFFPFFLYFFIIFLCASNYIMLFNTWKKTYHNNNIRQTYIRACDVQKVNVMYIIA